MLDASTGTTCVVLDPLNSVNVLNIAPNSGPFVVKNPLAGSRDPGAAVCAVSVNTVDL